MAEIYGIKPEQIKVKHSRTRICQSKKGYKCSGRFVKTFKGQKDCLHCLRFVPSVLSVARQEDSPSNGTPYFYKAVVAVDSIKTTDSAEDDEHD